MDTETYDGTVHWAHPVKDNEGDWVRYNDAQAEIARLQAEVERLIRDSYSREWAELRFLAAWNDAIEKAASLFTHPEEEGIADRIRELKE